LDANPDPDRWPSFRDIGENDLDQNKRPSNSVYLCKTVVSISNTAMQEQRAHDE